MAINYKLNSWCDAVYSYRDNNRKAEVRDWTRHWVLNSTCIRNVHISP
jgi:hypothetical protein